MSDRPLLTRLGALMIVVVGVLLAALRHWPITLPTETGDLPNMMSKRQQAHETPNRTLDWATAATEARRQRDAEAKVELSARQRQRRQEREAVNAWSPQHEISRIRRV
jgi:hypothetical protein